MHWLIVEDALRNREGHWFEYVGTFMRELRALGDEVTVLADGKAEPFILEELETLPVLPPSIWHRMSDKANALTRYWRVPEHAFNTWRSISDFLRQQKRWDAIFVPTVLVHHLLGWYFLIRFNRACRQSKVLLFFPNLPIRLRQDGSPAWTKSPTTRLMRLIFLGLRKDVMAGRVVIGVETSAMQTALAKLTGLPVTYFPHPVQAIAPAKAPATPALNLCSYGPGRQEKGSDLLQKAILLYLGGTLYRHARFVFQAVGDYKITDEAGVAHSVLPGLEHNSMVKCIREFFGKGEYAQHLRNTHIMLLPYRQSSYGLRVSRVVIEAMVNGIPVVATEGTTLWQQANEFGAAIPCSDGSVGSLHEAIIGAIFSYPKLRALAQEKQKAAQAHFSVENFRNILFPL
jgi:glycosyltransferase involved in cell wall biosynthesis